MTEQLDLVSLMKILEYRFKDEGLLLEALTHSSLVKGRHKNSGPAKDNDRLEFLGDRVLGIIISEELFRRYNTAEAGQLSRRYNAQVQKETLADIAQKMGLPRYIQMSSDLRASGGAKNPAMLEDCVEALIAALYLDGGMPAAKKFIKKHWWARFDAENAAHKDSKSALQEWAAKKGVAPPVYTVLEETGPDHNREFTIQVNVDKCSPTVAVAASKRMAEKMAAELMLKEQENG
ncbi:ribonuclease III [Alphaproteobacteria bacterium 46_93_T64]|nr:ribonuclease III [Alphaproteobacteria bacterium 46_93_T64]